MTFTRRSSSANIDFYRSTVDDGVYVEVLIDNIERVDGKLKARKIPRYSISIHRHNGKRWIETKLPTYTPTRRPRDFHLPNSVVTRLVREAS